MADWLGGQVGPTALGAAGPTALGGSQQPGWHGWLAGQAGGTNQLDRGPAGQQDSWTTWEPGPGTGRTAGRPGNLQPATPSHRGRGRLDTRTARRPGNWQLATPSHRGTAGPGTGRTAGRPRNLQPPEDQLDRGPAGQPDIPGNLQPATPSHRGIIALAQLRIARTQRKRKRSRNRFPGSGEGLATNSHTRPPISTRS